MLSDKNSSSKEDIDRFFEQYTLPDLQLPKNLDKREWEQCRISSIIIETIAEQVRSCGMQIIPEFLQQIKLPSTIDKSLRSLARGEDISEILHTCFPSREENGESEPDSWCERLAQYGVLLMAFGYEADTVNSYLREKLYTAV